MRGFKKLAISLSLILILLTFTVTVFAGDTESVKYTGTISEFNILLAKYDKATSVFSMDKALSAALAYSEKIDPATDEYKDAMARLDARELELACIYVDLVFAEATAEGKNEKLLETDDYLSRHPIDKTTEGLDAFESNYYIATVMTLDAYLSQCKTSDTSNAKHNAIDMIEEIAQRYSLALNDSFKADVELECFNCAKLYLAEIDVENLGVAQLSANFRQLDAFVEDHPFGSELSGVPDFHYEYYTKLDFYQKAYEKQKQETMSLAYSNDYSSVVRYNLTFDTEGIGNLTPELNTEGGEAVTYVGEDCSCGYSRNPVEGGAHAEDCGNKYYTVSYDRKNIHFRTKALIKSITDSMVFECDVTTFDKLPEGVIRFDDLGSTEGSSWEITYFSIAPNGDIVQGLDTTKVLVKGAVVPGKWTHISLVVDMVTNEAKLYVDYEHVATTMNLENKGHSYYYKPQYIRIGANPTETGASFSLDNIKLYGGYAPRDLDWYTNLSNEEKFVYNVSQLSNNNLTAAAQKQYYTAANMAASMYWLRGDYTFDASLAENAELKAAVDAFLKFDVNAINTKLGKENLRQLKVFYNKLKAVSKGEDNVKLRTYWLNLYDSYAASLGGIIDASEEYEEIAAYIAYLREEIAMETSAVSFTAAVNSFYDSAAYSRKVSALSEAQELYAFLDVSMLENTELYRNFYSALARYDAMPEVLAEYTVIENSKKLHACLDYVLSYGSAEDWDANYDSLNVHVATAREILAEGNIDIYYSNLGEMIESFEPMNVYFMEKLQKAHIEYIAAQLLLYEQSEFYFEQFGILRAIQVYIERNKVDYTSTEYPELAEENAELALLVKQTEEELLKLSTPEREEEYDSFLVENSQKFIEACESLKGTQDYLSMKAALESASVYFYNMDVGNALVQDAIAIYAMRESELKAINSYAKEFVNEVLLLAACEGNPLEDIIKCSKYLDKLVMQAPGAAAALEQYNAIVADYNAGIATLNNEITEINNCVATVQNTAVAHNLTTLVLKALSR